MTLEIVALRDPSVGSSAQLLPGFGFNCFRFTAVADGGEIDVLWAEDGFETGARRPSGSGIPILFPFPGRIGGTTLDYQGRSYQLEAGDGRGNAIHGFVLNRPWRVVEQSDQHVVGQFQASVDDPSLRDSWPADFRITLAYRLAGNTLSLDARLENPGETPLPMGFGVHPYFRVPLGPAGAANRGAADRCRVRVAAAEYWELADMLATGRRLPAADRGPLEGGMDFADTKFDDVFTALGFDGDWSTSTIDDPQSGRTVRVSFDRAFRECVVYNPPHREAICIEPYTCVPGAIELAARGIDAGLRTMMPGESLNARVRIAVV
ncbi:MAG: aldose 1-epimerase [Pirellulales bacterium]